MKQGWIIIWGSSICTYNTSGADIGRRYDLAQMVIVNVVVGGEFENGGVI